MIKKTLFFKIFLTSMLFIGSTDANQIPPQPSNAIFPTVYSQGYPFMNNQMRAATNPGVNMNLVQGPSTTFARDITPRTIPGPNANQILSNQKRNVVPRNATVSIGQAQTMSARAGALPQTIQYRRVMPRTAVNQIADRSARSDASAYNNMALRGTEAAANNTTESITSDRCLADYNQCMNMYCERPKTAYNKCYCSARLAQIDSQYQPAIDSLIKQILTLQGGGTFTEDEMKQYWADTVGKYTGDNSWTNIDDALNIDWADTESRVRGQNAFITGHEYCVQHLRGCFYMAANLRDAYRSDIARDCAVYEKGLQKIKNAAESIVENYSE